MSTEKSNEISEVKAEASVIASVSGVNEEECKEAFREELGPTEFEMTSVGGLDITITVDTDSLTVLDEDEVTN